MGSAVQRDEFIHRPSIKASTPDKEGMLSRAPVSPRRLDADSLINRADLRGGALDTAAGKTTGLYFRHIRETSFSAAAAEINAVSYCRCRCCSELLRGALMSRPPGAAAMHACLLRQVRLGRSQGHRGGIN